MDLNKWLELEKISAIVLDQRYGLDTKIFEIIMAGEGLIIEQGFIADDGAISVYLVK